MPFELCVLTIPYQTEGAEKVHINCDTLVRKLKKEALKCRFHNETIFLAKSRGAYLLYQQPFRQIVDVESLKNNALSKLEWWQSQYTSRNILRLLPVPSTTPPAF